MVYRTLSNNPVERTVVTCSHVKWQNSFTTEELDRIIAYCDSVGTERAKKSALMKMIYVQLRKNGVVI